MSLGSRTPEAEPARVPVPRLRLPAVDLHRGPPARSGRYAWGRYWGWDPRAWALVTWVIYACYLHARSTAGWRGTRAAVIALIGVARALLVQLRRYQPARLRPAFVRRHLILDALRSCLPRQFPPMGGFSKVACPVSRRISTHGRLLPADSLGSRTIHIHGRFYRATGAPTRGAQGNAVAGTSVGQMEFAVWCPG